MTRLLPLFFLTLLSGCAEHPNAKPSASLFVVQEWPQATNVQTQSGVAKYITRGKAAYDSCKVNVDALRRMTFSDDKN